MHHPLLESFILSKWQKVKIFFNIQFLITIIFVVAFSIFTTMKCLTNQNDESRYVAKDVHIAMGVLVIPLLVEIILVEIYLLLGVQQIKLYWMQGLLKVTALGLAIVNISLFNDCDKLTREVNRELLLEIKLIFKFLPTTRYRDFPSFLSGSTCSR